MANPITILEESKARLESLNTALAKTNALILEISETSRKLGGDLFKPRQSPKKVNDTLKARATAEEKLILLIKEKNTITRNLERGEAKLTVALQGGNKALALQRFELQQLNRGAKQAAVLSSALATEYQKQSVKLIQLRTKYKDVALVQGESSRAAKKLQQEVQRLDARLKSVDASVGQFQRSVGNYGKAMQGAVGAARKLAAAMGLVGGAFLAIRVLRDAVGVIKDFDKANATLSAVLQVTRKEMSGLTDESQRLGAITVKTAQEVVGLQIAYARLGFSQAEIIELTESTIQGSIALNANLAETAELTGAMVNSFDEFSTIDAPEILDIMSLATAKSALNFQKLQKGLPIVAGAANAAGVTFTTLVALMGKLSDAGIDVSTSSTAIRNIFIKSKAAGENYTQIIDRIKNSQDKLTTSVDAFGVRAAVSASILASNIDATEELDITLQGAAGTMQSMADKELDTLEGALQLLKSAWQGNILAVDGNVGVADKLKKSIKFLADNLTNILKGIVLATKAWLAYKLVILITSLQQKALAASLVKTTAVQGTSTIATYSLTAAWVRFTAVLRANLLGIIVVALFAFYEIMQRVNTSVAKTGEKMRELSNEFTKQQETAIALNDKMSTMVDRYDELTKKAKDLGGVTKLTNVEQAELDRIIKSLALSFPGATKTVEEYSNALGLNTDIIREAIKESKDFANEKAQTKIIALTKNTESLNKSLVNFNVLTEEGTRLVERSGGGVTIYRNINGVLKIQIGLRGKIRDATREERDALGTLREDKKKQILLNDEAINKNKDIILGNLGLKTSVELLADAEKKRLEEAKAKEDLTKDEEDAVVQLTLAIKNYKKELADLRGKSKITLLDEEAIISADKALKKAEARLKKIQGTKGASAKSSTTKKTVDYEFKVNDESLAQVIQAQKDIALSSEASNTARTNALAKFEDDTIDLLNKRIAHEKKIVDESKLLATDKDLAKRLIDLKYNKDFEDLENDKLAIAKKLIQDNLNAIKEAKNIERETLITANAALIGERKAEYLKDITDAAGNKKLLLEIEEQYKVDIIKIKQELALALLALKLKELKALSAGETDPDKKAAFERAIAAVKIAQSTLATDHQIADLKRLEEATAEFEAFKRKTITDASNNIANALGIDSGKVEKFLDGAINGFDSVLEGIGAASNVAGDIVGAVFDAKILRYEEDIQKNNDYFAALLDNENLTEQQRSALEAERDAKNAVLEKKKRSEQIKKAKFEKVSAAFQIGINTAVAISGAIKAFPLTGGLPWSAIVAALGALQIAAVLAKPLPKYAGGRVGGPAETAWVGDGGISEIIEKPNKNIQITPPTPTLVRLGRGDIVHSSAEDYLNSQKEDVQDGIIFRNIHKHIAIANMLNQGHRFIERQAINNNKDVVKAIKDNRVKIKIINNNNLSDMAQYWASFNDTL